MVAPARLLAVPNRTIPLIRNVRGGPTRSTRTWSPTLKWYFWAVAASITTSCDEVGADPSESRSADSCAFWS
jgi:hypothetical protein